MWCCGAAVRCCWRMVDHNGQRVEVDAADALILSGDFALRRPQSAGNSLQKMAAAISGNRPTGVNHHMNWETLTHGRWAGLPPL
jgi:hypothetical protein